MWHGNIILEKLDNWVLSRYVVSIFFSFILASVAILTVSYNSDVLPTDTITVLWFDAIFLIIVGISCCSIVLGVLANRSQNYTFSQQCMMIFSISRAFTGGKYPLLGLVAIIITAISYNEIMGVTYGSFFFNLIWYMLGISVVLNGGTIAYLFYYKKNSPNSHSNQNDYETFTDIVDPEDNGLNDLRVRMNDQLQPQAPFQ